MDFTSENVHKASTQVQGWYVYANTCQFHMTRSVLILYVCVSTRISGPAQ